MILSTAKEVLREKLPPQAFQYVRSCWWHWRIYKPHLRRCSPKVECFPKDRLSELMRLGDINLLAPTKMCYVMSKYGSDKGNGWHNYTVVYSALFGKLRDQPLKIFEIGLGSNNPDVPFNMGLTGHPGASLRGWRDLFPHALVFGADIDRGILFEEDRVKTFWCDQLDSAAVRDLWLQPPLRAGVDIIVDDGLHTFEANTFFLHGSLEQLRPGGFYVVEDVASKTLDQWREHLETVCVKQFPNHEFGLIQLPNASNNLDNNVIVAHRPVGH